MRLPLFTLAGFLLLVGVRTESSADFKLNLMQNCFVNRDNEQQEGELWVHGQKNPLANTLENFISLMEKYEAENPDVSLEEEAFVLMNNYTLENAMIMDDGSLGSYTFQNRRESDYPDTWLTRSNIPQGEEAFSAEEKCSLFFMMSHGVLPKFQVQNSGGLPRSRGNFSYDMFRSVSSENEMYPQEIGVVSIRGTEYAVALSRVVFGIYMGLTEDTITTTDKIDKLYAVTLAGDVMMLNWTKSSPVLGNGAWLSLSNTNPPLDTDSVCPMVYKHEENAEWPFTFASLRGGADGLILGKLISDLKDKSDLKLSEVLRMYYSRSGIKRKDYKSATFCDRQDILDSVGPGSYSAPLDADETLKQQIEFFAQEVKSRTMINENIVKIAALSTSTYRRIRDSIYDVSRNSDLYKYCHQQISTEKVETLEFESPADVLVIMDTDDEKHYRKQQLIVGHLARRLDLRRGGSRMTIALDQRVDGASLELKTIVNDTYSSACAACLVSQLAYEGNSAGQAAQNDIVITAIENMLVKRKEDEKKMNGVKGKIVVYFNFRETEVENTQLKSALTSLHTNHEDVKIYAVGSAKEVLLKYARMDGHMIIEMKVGDKEEDIGKMLFDRIIKEPAILQYTECDQENTEGSAVFEGLVSPYSMQHWYMPARYFLKSRKIKLFFDSPQGDIRVCYSRSTTKPEDEMANCKNTTGGNRRLEFNENNPCKGYNRINCAPFYFAVIGMGKTDENTAQQYCLDTPDTQCKTIYQTKFKVSHEGIRCSGCLGLVSAPIFLLLSFIITRLLNKKF